MSNQRLSEDDLKARGMAARSITWRVVLNGLRDAVTALIAIYGAGVTVFIILHLLVGERLALVGVLNNFSPLLLLPAVPLALIAVIIGRWPLSLTLVPAIMMLSLSYGNLLAPNRAHASAGGQSLTLLTYNLHGDRQTDGHIPVAELVKQANADVVLLQELSPTIAQALKPLYPYSALHTNKDALVQGQGVLSRYPILEDDYWLMGLGDQRVVLDVNGTHVTVYNVHSLNPFVFKSRTIRIDASIRDSVIEDILRRTSTEKSPLIVAGDFNMTDQTHSYDMVSARYHDTFREVGSWLGFTFPADRQIVPPLARIDYVFHDDSVQSVAAHVWPTAGGSDHRPVWVRLSIQ